MTEAIGTTFSPLFALTVGIAIANMYVELQNSVGDYFFEEIVSYTNYFIPPPPEPTYFEMVCQFVEDYQIMFWSAVSVFGIIMSCVFIIVVKRILAIRPIVRLSCRMRGYQYESMQEGSSFKSGELPNSIVKIEIPGILTNTHNGMGWRFNNLLVTATHVIEGHDLVVVRGSKGEVLLEKPNYVRSKIPGFEDLCYIILESSIWTRLGTCKATVVKEIPAANTIAKAYNWKNQYSQGVVSRGNSIGMLIYTGSTIRGMSGTPYMLGNMVMATHSSSISGTNIGLVATHIAKDAARLVINEAVYGTENPVEQDVFYKNTGWDSKTLDRLMDDVDSGKTTDWSKPIVIDYNASLNFESAKKNLEAQWKAREAETAAKVVKATGQADDQPDVYFTCHELPTINDRVENLEQIVVKLQEYIIDLRSTHARTILKEKVASGQTKPIDYPCDLCDQVCTSSQALANHKENSHTSHKVFKCPHCDIICKNEIRLNNHMKNCVVKEAMHREAVVGCALDAKKNQQIKMNDTFLGPSTSQESRSRNSKNTSKSSKEQLLYQCLQANQKLMDTLMKK